MTWSTSPEYPYILNIGMLTRQNKPHHIQFLDTILVFCVVWLHFPSLFISKFQVGFRLVSSPYVFFLEGDERLGSNNVMLGEVCRAHNAMRSSQILPRSDWVRLWVEQHSRRSGGSPREVSREWFFRTNASTSLKR